MSTGEHYDVQARIVIDERPSMLALDLIDRRMRQLGHDAVLIGHRISMWLGAGFADAAQAPGVRQFREVFRDLEQRADVAGDRIRRSMAFAPPMVPSFAPGGGGSTAGGMAAGGMMGRLGPLALLGGGGAFGAMRGGRGLLGLHTEQQDATAGIAALLSMSMGAGAAHRQAGQLTDGLRMDAAGSAGGFGDHLAAFQQLMTPMQLAGGSLDDTRAFTKKTVAAGFALRGQEGPRLLAMDIQQALTAGLGSQTTKTLNMVLQRAGADIGGFNQLSTVDRLKTIEEAFRSLDGAVDLMGKTWNARMKMLRETVRDLFRRLTRPLFDRWSEQLESANSWLKRNEEALDRMVSTWGPRLVGLWDHLIAKASTYAAIVAGVAVGGRVGLGSLRAQAALGGQPLLGRGGALAGAMPAIRATLSTFGAAAMRLTWVTALVTAAFVGIQGAMRDFLPLAGWFAGVTGEFARQFSELGNAFTMMGAEGSVLTWLGAAIIGVVGGVIWVFTQIIKVFSAVALFVGMGLRFITNFLERLVVGVRYLTGIGDSDAAARRFLELEEKGRAQRDEGLESFQRMWGGYAPHDALDTGDEASDKAITEFLTHIDKVEITVRAETLDDPARVAVAMEEVFDRLREASRQSRRGLMPT